MRRIFSVVAVLAVLVLAADRGAAWAAERVLSKQIEQRAELTSAPGVDIEGFPFLTQVLQGRYTRVQVDVGDSFVVRGLRVDRSTGVAEGLRAPFQDLVNRDLDTLRVEDATVEVHMPFKEFERLVDDEVGASGLDLRFSEGDEGRLAMAGELATPLGAVRLRAPVDAVVNDGAMRLKLRGNALGRLPDAARDLVEQGLDRSFALPDLPMGFEVTSTEVDGTGVSLVAQSRNTRLTVP